MCLFKNIKIHPNCRPLRAKSDVVCFKVLIKTSNKFITPHQGMEISSDCLYYKQPLKASILSYFRFFKYHILGRRGYSNRWIYSYLRNFKLTHIRS